EDGGNRADTGMIRRHDPVGTVHLVDPPNNRKERHKGKQGDELVGLSQTPADREHEVGQRYQHRRRIRNGIPLSPHVLDQRATPDRAKKSPPERTNIAPVPLLNVAPALVKPEDMVSAERDERE